jgi:hypothetical protein
MIEAPRGMNAAMFAKKRAKRRDAAGVARRDATKEAQGEEPARAAASSGAPEAEGKAGGLIEGLMKARRKAKRDLEAPARGCEADGAPTRWNSPTSIADRPKQLAPKKSCVCEASEVRKRKQEQRGEGRSQTAAAAIGYVKSRDSVGEATIRGSELSEHDAGVFVLGGDSNGGGCLLHPVTTAPAAFSPLVGPPSAVYEKKMRGQLRFHRTLAYQPLWPSFFVRAALWFLAVFALSALANTSAAQPKQPDPTWAIEVVGESQCAGDPDLEERLWAQIPDHQRAPLTSAELRARVSIAKDRTASVSVYDQATRREAGQRRITLPQAGCRAAGEALGLVVAVMVEAGRGLLTAAEPEPEPEPTPKPPEPEPEAEQAPEPAPSSRYVRPERHAWQGPPAGHDLALVAGTNVGLLPSWGLGASLGWGIRGQRIWPIWFQATGWLAEVSKDGRARLGAAYATVTTCPLRWENQRVRLRLCPGVALGAMWADARKLPSTKDQVPLLIMGALQGALHVKLVGPLEFILDARLEVPLRRLKFVYYRNDGDIPQVHLTAPVTGSFFGGLGLRFR